MLGFRALLEGATAMKKSDKKKLVFNQVSLRELTVQQLASLEVNGGAPCTCRGSGCGSGDITFMCATNYC
jgi:hypothetical protein